MSILGVNRPKQLTREVKKVARQDGVGREVIWGYFGVESESEVLQDGRETRNHLWFWDSGTNRVENLVYQTEMGCTCAEKGKWI